jgi:uncharacterized protein
MPKASGEGHNPSRSFFHVTFSSPIRTLDEACAAVAGASCWVLTDGKAGDEAQCLGVAERLGLHPLLRHVSPRAPWVWLMPRGPIDPAEAPGNPGSPIAPPWPDICIASGRRSVAYLRRVRRESSGRTLTVFLKDPGTGTGTADMIWAPAHDAISGPNVLKTLTSPHRISPERLAEARAAVPAWFEADRMHVGVMLGGDSRHHRFTDGDVTILASALEAVAAAGARLVVTPSRRTPSALSSAVAALCAERGGWFWDGATPNPYLAILAHADHLIVTADSVNMLGEAAATGKPIHLFTPSGGHAKISSFVDGLVHHGAVRPLGRNLETFAYEPVDATPAIAIAVAEAFVASKRSAARRAL